jgi:branched-chain amino acid transport system substrate-binding protein
MKKTSAVSRRLVLGGSVATLASPPIISRAAATTRGVTDTEIIIGTMTDLSGVTAVQGVNNANAMRMAFDDVNARGGIHGRKIRWIVEDMEYIVPKAVQAMNKLLNRDNIFFALGNGGTPHNAAVMPSMFEKNVPNVFPLTCARSMYEPFNRLKFGQFSSYYDQMRAGVKHFVEVNGKKTVGSMYQDTDFGRDVHAGVVAQLQAMGLKLAAETSHRPTDSDFNAAVQRQHEAGCDLICMGTIVKDTTLILQTIRKIDWNVDCCGQFASYSTAVAEAPGEPAEGFYAMAPALYRYPDDPKGLWNRCELLGRGRLYLRNLHDRSTGKGRSGPDARQLHRRHGKHEGLARYIRRSGTFAKPDRPPRIKPVVSVGDQEPAVDTNDGRAAKFLIASRDRGLDR